MESATIALLAAAIVAGTPILFAALGELMAEHVSIVGSNFKASGNEVNWDARISSDRFAELGIDPLESRVRTVLEGSLIRSIGLNFSPDSVKKIESVTAAQPG